MHISPFAPMSGPQTRQDTNLYYFITYDKRGKMKGFTYSGKFSGNENHWRVFNGEEIKKFITPCTGIFEPIDHFMEMLDNY